jgi:hypothetical protein
VIAPGGRKRGGAQPAFPDLPQVLAVATLPTALGDDDTVGVVALVLA